VRQRFPSTQAGRYVKELEQESLLRKIQISSVIFYSADRSSQLFLIQKKLDNLRKIYASGLIEHINQHLSNPSMILFGSYSRGEDIEASDIDLYIESAQKTLNLKQFEKQLGRAIHLHIFESLTKIPRRELRNNIINGIPLSGFVEAFR
jgi:predicted nucleotidyltransferase